MNTYISLLRGINISGQKIIKMERLRLLYTNLGFKNVKTYIQTGNVIFDSKEEDVNKICDKIQKKIKKDFSFDVPILIKTPKQLQTILRNNPYTKEEQLKQVALIFLYEPLTSAKDKKNLLDAINAVKHEAEQVFLTKHCVYCFYGNGQARTKLQPALFEKKLGNFITMRNLRTSNKVLELCS